jgi:hypothetical protein
MTPLTVAQEKPNMNSNTGAMPLWSRRFAPAALTFALLFCCRPAAVMAQGWTLYRSDDGVALNYPAAWQKKENSDKDCLLKVGPANSFMELSLSASQTGNISISTMAQYLQEGMLEKQPEFKHIKTKPLRFGPGQKREGLLKEVTFKVGELPVDQEYVFFKTGDKIYTLSKTCRFDERAAQNQVWNQVLSSVSVGTTKAVSPQSASTAPVKPASASSPWKVFSTTAKGISFSYPANFKDADSDQPPDHPANLSLNEPGKMANISVYCGDMHPAETVNHMAAMIEEKHFATQKNYRQLHEENRLGGKGILEMSVREATCDLKGLPIKQLIAFFKGNDRFWAVTVSTHGWTANDTNALFSRVISSIEVQN